MRPWLAILTLSLLVAAPARANRTAPVLEGDYLEARTCNLLVGPCHFNAEVLDRGREATLVWHVRAGRWQGVELVGRTVVAVVAADRNLQDLSAQSPARRSVLYLDAAATPAQREALRDFATRTLGELLGQVVAVETAAIRFDHEPDADYRVQVGEALSLEASRLICDHCTQKPYQLWYSPLAAGVQARAGKATRHHYRDRFLSAHWQLGEENSVFAGTFEVASR